jgi:hypothetical protein
MPQGLGDDFKASNSVLDLDTIFNDELPRDYSDSVFSHDRFVRTIPASIGDEMDPILLTTQRYQHNPI